MYRHRLGDRMYVPQELLDLDSKNVTFRGIDPETGAVVEGTAPLVLDSDCWRPSPPTTKQDFSSCRGSMQA
jgi:hypothetical protein